MGGFNSDDHFIYYCGQEFLRRYGVAIIVKKRVQNAVLGCHLKNDRMIFVCFQGKPFNITVIKIYAPNSNAILSSQKKGKFPISPLPAHMHSLLLSTFPTRVAHLS